MRPLVEKNAGGEAAKTSGPGKGSGFERLGAVLKRHWRENTASGNDAKEAREDHEAKVETVVEEGVVQKIIVHCSCGSVTEIDCRYEG
ncbi:MAG: hypothetical protein R6V45_04660 [Oceanipulchritudo sp.]